MLSTASALFSDEKAKPLIPKQHAPLTKEEKEILENREVLENLELLRNLDKYRLLDLLLENPNALKDSEAPTVKKEEQKKK
jgi:hypothetical protein